MSPKAVIECDDRVRRSNSRNNRRWCGGKEGIEHQKEWIVKGYGGWSVEVCRQCGRHFGYKSSHINLGSEVKRLRKQKGMTQLQLAEASGLLQEQICYMEIDRRFAPEGRVRVSLGMWQKVLEPLGWKLVVSLEEIESPVSSGAEKGGKA